MFTFQTSDQKEVRRFRMAQLENKSSAPAAWTITIIPEEPKPTILARSAPRVCSFAEDLR